MEEQKRNDFLETLYQAFSKASFKDIRVFIKLFDDSGTRIHSGDSNWNSLRYQNSFYLCVLVYLAARGSGTYTEDQIVADVELFDEQKKEFQFRHGWVNEILCWARDKGVLGEKFNKPKSYSETDRTPVEVDITPLFYRFGFSGSKGEEGLSDEL
jgi:hypothetical protein